MNDSFSAARLAQKLKKLIKEDKYDDVDDGNDLDFGTEDSDRADVVNGTSEFPTILLKNN